jgi:hypothetical protein
MILKTVRFRDWVWAMIPPQLMLYDDVSGLIPSACVASGVPVA